ncbi:MAG: ribokinase [Sphingomonadales bacterium]
MAKPRIAVLGSVNLDLIARAPKLPAPGETVTGATLDQAPGGKGANQALAARRLGADVALIARIGADAYGEQALALLRAEGVDLSACLADPDLATGLAMIVVDKAGHNQITVASGANAAMQWDEAALPAADGLICQLEIPVATVARAAQSHRGFFCLNIAPVHDLPKALVDRADLIVANEGEARDAAAMLQGHGGMLAITRGGDGAVLSRAGAVIAEAAAPRVDVVDTTGAGDCFTAALTVRLLAGDGPADALAYACAAGACAVRKPGAQPALPSDAEVRALLAGQ